MSEHALRRFFTVRVDDEEWCEIAALSGAGPSDNVFVVDSASGTVAFGDGVSGRRPASGAAVTVSWREGSGHDGNVQVSVSMSWPPTVSRYVLGFGPSAIQISGYRDAVEQFGGEKRVNYFEGQLLLAADLNDEQQYLTRKRHRHNQALHGSGVVTGLAVTLSSPDASSPSLIIEPGLALDRRGRELELFSPAIVALSGADCAQYVILAYTERKTDPVPSPLDDPSPMFSRIAEGVLIGLGSDTDISDGLALARVTPMPNGAWAIDSGFEPIRIRK